MDKPKMPDDNTKPCFRIESAAHDGCRDIPGYIVTNGLEGADFKVYGWAATLRLAKKVLSNARDDMKRLAA